MREWGRRATQDCGAEFAALRAGAAARTRLRAPPRRRGALWHGRRRNALGKAFVSKYAPRVGALLPPARLAWLFSVETMYAGPPLGWRFAGLGTKLGISPAQYRDLIWRECAGLGEVVAAHDGSMPAPPPPELPTKPAEMPVYEVAFFLACLLGAVAAIGATLYAVLRFLDGKEQSHLHHA